MVAPRQEENNPTLPAWEHSTHQAFFEYYRDESVSEQAFERFKSIRKTVLSVLAKEHGEGVDTLPTLDVADIGCGAGTQSVLWAELGHSVHGLDVNEPLIELARQRTGDMGITAQFHVGTATDLPWENNSMDVCIMPELLEHVPDWRKVLDECSRILRPRGVLFLTTTNKLSPLQEEFRLPLYSWYPKPVKRYCEHLARTTHPKLAGYATYPAVNWFTYYQLRRELGVRGLESKDKFETMDSSDSSVLKGTLISAIQHITPLKWIALAALPYCSVIAIKRG